MKKLVFLMMTCASTLCASGQCQHDGFAEWFVQFKNSEKYLQKYKSTLQSARKKYSGFYESEDRRAFTAYLMELYEEECIDIYLKLSRESD